jgi:hypothetical protein
MIYELEANVSAMMHRIQLTLRRMKTDLSNTDSFKHHRAPFLKHAVIESFWNYGLVCGNKINALPKVCSAFRAGGACDHASSLRRYLERT